MKIKEIISLLHSYAYIQLQEDFDNSGLNIGNPEDEIKGILICLDVTLEILQEAIENNLNFIISHHPLIFNKLKKINTTNEVEKLIILAIKNDISIYCGHTNFDNYDKGVNYKIAEKLNLKNIKILSPKTDTLEKISVFVPNEFANIVREEMFLAGAGKIGNYDSCSYNIEGFGSYRANENANPFLGEIGKLHFEKETKIEMILQKHNEQAVISAMIKAHPYEEVAFDLIQLKNNSNIGLGAYGELENEIVEVDFLKLLKETFFVKNIRHTKLRNKKIKKVALCGGSGAFLIGNVMNLGADVFVTGDMKYHDFFLAENKILLCDIGHYESEQFVKEIFYDIISNSKKEIDFVVKISEKNTNPIYNY